MSEEPRFAPNGNRLPERLPVGHRLVDTTKQHWLIGPSIGCGGFGDIYLTRQYLEEVDDLKRLTQEQIIRESSNWTNVIKFEHFSGPLFAEINFYLRCARKETIDEYMIVKKLKHLGIPRFVASGIYDPLRGDNPPPVCKISSSKSTTTLANGKSPAIKRGRATAGAVKKANELAANGKQKRIPASAQAKEKKYRFLVLQRFGDDVQKIWTRANEIFDMQSAFNIALKVIDTLEYIHSHGYVHADVKASNLLIEWHPASFKETHNQGSKTKNNNNTINENQYHSSADSGNGSLETLANDRKRVARGAKSTAVKRERSLSVVTTPLGNKSSIEKDDQIYLVDFGLVERFYSKDGSHREYVEDQRRANNGTVEFSSRDAHIGAFSRRSDLESLAYNLLYWVSGGRLPWTNVLKDHQLVEASKKWYMDNLEIFVNYCFNEEADPIDPLKLLRGLDPTDNGHSSTSSSHNHTNGRSNGRVTHSTTNNNNGSTISTTSTKASTINSKASKTSAKSKKSSSSTSTTSSTHDSIMCTALYDFLSYITKLSFKDEPDYYLLKSILSNAIGDGSSARTARKRGSHSLKKTPPKLPLNCENPTPAMREILRKMKLSSKKH